MTQSKADSLLRLPGRSYDPAARVLREQFLSGEVDIDEFLKENGYHLPRTSEQRFTNQVQTYATASIFIDQFWEYLQKQAVPGVMEVLRKQHAPALYRERIQMFDRFCCQVINIPRDKFLEESFARRKAGEGSVDDDVQLCFFVVARLRRKEEKKLPFPSMLDLVSFMARLAEVAPLVFERDVGRPASREDIIGLMRQPAMVRFCVEFMASDRHAMHPLLARMAGRRKLKTLAVSFDPQQFRIEGRDDSRTLRLKQDVVDAHRERHERAARRRVRRGQAPRPTLGCPALYGGHLKEMYDWTLGILEFWI